MKRKCLGRKQKVDDLLSADSSDQGGRTFRGSPKAKISSKTFQPVGP
jgi:hypothetical protein